MRRQLLLLLFVFAGLNANAQAPAVSSFSPASGPIGSTVTINGNNFNTVPALNIVHFGATRARVTAATATQLTVTVLPGATYQPISVVNSATGLTGYSTVPFVPTFTSKHALTQTDFDLPQAFPTGAGPVQVAVADFDGDGKTDIACVNRDRGTISIFINQSTTTGSFSIGSFFVESNLVSIADPFSVTIGDLNGDGLPDLVVANQNSTIISIYLNSSTPGTVSFQPALNFTLGNGTGATAVTNIAIADLDGDGKADVIAATNGYYNQTVIVLRNTYANDNLSFETEAYFYGGDNISSLNAADLDGDGLPDLVLTNNEISILKNTSSPGRISFATKTDILTNGTPVTASIADMDNDGKPDLILANPGSFANPFNSTISVYRNVSTPGNISLAANIDFASGVPTSALSIGDLDGDGLPDIASTSGQYIQILRNTTVGNGITLTAQVSITDSNPVSIAIGDLNGDGKPDIVTADFAGTAIKVFQNDPQPTIVNFPPAVSSFSPQTGPVGTTVTIKGTNFNTSATGNTVFFGATKATVSAATATQLTVIVPAGATYQPFSILNTSTNLSGYSASPFITTFQSKTKITNYDPKVDFATGDTPTAVAIADIDGDGKPDIVVLNSHGNSISIYRNISVSGSITAASFAARVDFTTPTDPTSVSIGDLNGDGKPDIVIGCMDGNSITIFPNSSTPGNITMASFVNYSQPSPVNSVGIADIDGDGKPDIVAVINDNSIAVYRNKSVGGSIGVSFVKDNLNLTTDTGPGQLSIADIDGDGKPDIVVTVMGNTSPGSLAIFRNTSISGKTSFVSGGYPNLGDWPAALGIADIDGDGKPDIVVAVGGFLGTNNLSVLPNNSTIGNIAFGPLAFFQGNSTGSLGIADLDGDGKPDMAGINRDGNAVFILSNTSTTGNIAFTPKINFPTGNYPEAVAVGDLDGDGKPDLLVPNALANTFSILRYNADAVPAPAINSISPIVGESGSSITISGLNLSGATAVSFGGIPATSFTVNSSATIKAIVGAGSTGDVSVVTPTGTASLGGFIFVPVPTITVGGPTTFDAGGSVLLTANPDTSLYTYQWLKDGKYISGGIKSTYTAIESGSYTVILSYFNTSQVSTQIVEVNVRFTLPPTNFTIAITSATCKGSDNGSINITAAQSMSYTATVTGNGVNSAVPFTTTGLINNLAAGTYNVCITIAGESDYQQCYTAVITEPKDLSLYSTVNDKDNTINLSLSGGAEYNIKLNGVLYTTTDNTITLPLTEGNNELVITTDKLCQGTVQKLINISGKINPYPVPFQNTLNLNIGNTTVNNVSVEIHNVSDGKLVYSRQYVNQTGVLQLDVSGLGDGVYALHLSMDNSEKIFKIMKK